MLDGVWLPLGAEFCGEALPLPDTRLVITGDRYVVEAAETRDEGVLRIDASASPPGIDIVGQAGPNAGKTLLAIFRVRGDRLQLCYDVGEPPCRPTTFATAQGSTRILIRYRRVTG